MNRVGFQPVPVGMIGFGSRFRDSLLGLGWYGFCCQKPVQIMTWCSPAGKDLDWILNSSEFGLWLPKLYPVDLENDNSDEEEWPFLIVCRQERSSSRQGRLILQGRVERVWRRGMKESLSVLDNLCHSWSGPDH